ncbi:unnamed protein product [Microthlaspi erraticum]|uniref:F-box domain-containing protein n=1 Tax=Microthlaspi erraticum TaxID=1685480 RepID=A0A6D2HQX3_9BRAS|nr:unnamed protein product [Microthlaspi erraticum]
MAKRKPVQHVTSDDNVSVGGETDYFDLIPVDLFNDIISRLPVTCQLRLRCVSKNWYSSIILGPPRLLLAFNVESNLFVYSSTQPKDLDVDSSVVATPHHTSLGTSFYKLCRPLRGLVCILHSENNSSWAVISNPITGEHVTTPKLSVRGASTSIDGKAEYSFGYDPIDKRFKVLRITWLSCKKVKWGVKYHVLTLETGNSNLSWRKIKSCTTLHYPLNDAS